VFYRDVDFSFACVPVRFMFYVILSVRLFYECYGPSCHDDDHDDV